MRHLPTKDPTLVQALSLYLLLLAFFVVLFNASRYDSGRAAAVGESLTSTFRSQGKPSTSPESVVSRTGLSPGGEIVLDRVGNLVRTELRAARIETVRAGEILRVEFPSGELFRPGSAGIRIDRFEFIHALAALLREAPEGLRHKVEIRIGPGPVSAARLRGAVPLPVDRAAALAQVLVERGAAEGTVSAGIHPDSRPVAVFYFRLLPVRAQTRTEWSDALGAGR